MKNIVLSFILLSLCAALNAQTADFIQTLLKTPAVNYAQTARFVLKAAEVTGFYDKTNGQDTIYCCNIRCLYGIILLKRR